MKQRILKEAQDLTTTSSEIAQLDVKVLRSACQNAVVMAMMLLSVPRSRLFTAIVTHPVRPIDEWHGTANAACRDSDQNRDIVVGQVSGGFFQHLYRIIGSLGDVEVLSDAGFMDFRGSPPEDMEWVVRDDDELAGIFGSLVVALLAARLRRTLWLLRSWPFSNGPAERRGVGSERSDQ
jgi:hypothetical protein